MSTSSRFETFLTNIVPTTKQLDDAKTKAYGVCKKLHDYYYGTPYNGSTSLLIGSYAKGTHVRPARDIDVMFLLPLEEYSDSSSLYNVQSNLLQKIRRILQEKYPSTSIQGDGPVVVVNFSNEHFVELVPAFRLKSGKFYVPATRSGGSWEIVDPVAEIKQINESDRNSNGNTTNLVRMLKKWQDHCNVPIKSLVLELRAVNFLKKYEHKDKGFVYYDWLVRDYFEELLDYVGFSCEMPGLDERISYGSDWESKALSAYNRALKACRYEYDKDDFLAVLEWKKIFGNNYWFNLS